MEKGVVEEEVVEEEVVAEEVMKELLLKDLDAEEENVEEEEVEELLKFMQDEGIMVEIPKALVHRWKRHSYCKLKTL